MTAAELPSSTAVLAPRRARAVAWSRAAVERWALWGIVLLGLLLRLRGAGDWNSTRPNSAARLVGDEPGYNNLALGLLHGQFFTWEGRVPLYPIWLAGAHWLTRSSYDAIPYVQSLLGLTVIPLTFLLGARVFGRRAGLLAALLSAVSYTLIHQAFLLQSEIFYTPVVLILAIALLDALRRPSVAAFAWVGGWVAISDLIRPTLLLFPLALAVLCMGVFGLRTGGRYALIAAVVTGVLLTPWVAFGYARHHALYPLATSNAFLWQGSPEYYHLVKDEGYTYNRVWSEVIYAPDDQAHWPTTVAGDRYWTRRALRSIADEPLIYLRYAVEKVGTYWVGDPNADWGDARVFDESALRRVGYTRGDARQYMLMRLLPIFALPALYVTRRRWRALLPIYALLLYATLLHAATHAEARLSDPFQPFLLLVIAAALVAAYDAARRVRPAARPAPA